MIKSPIHNDNKESVPMFGLLISHKQEKKIEIPISESPNNQNFNTGRWSEEEHQKFVDGVLKYGNDWKKVQELIKTRSSTQARSHAQKFFLKIKKLFNVDEDKPFNLVNEGKEGKLTQDKFSVKYFSEILCPQNNKQNSTLDPKQLIQEKEKLLEILAKFKNYSNSSDSSQNSNYDESFENSFRKKSKPKKLSYSFLHKPTKKIFEIKKFRKLSHATNPLSNGFYDDQYWSFLEPSQKNGNYFYNQNEILTTTHSAEESRMKNGFEYNLNMVEEQKYNNDTKVNNSIFENEEILSNDHVFFNDEDNLLNDFHIFKKDNKTTNTSKPSKEIQTSKRINPFYIDFDLCDKEFTNKEDVFRTSDNSNLCLNSNYKSNIFYFQHREDENELSRLKW